MRSAFLFSFVLLALPALTLGCVRRTYYLPEGSGSGPDGRPVSGCPDCAAGREPEPIPEEHETGCGCSGEAGPASVPESPPREESPASIEIPFKGLVARCCVGPVEKGLGGIDAVKSVELRKDGDAYVAEILLKSGHGLSTSDIRKGLEQANRGMGDAMGTTYEVDDSLDLAAVHFFRTETRPDEAELRTALARTKGFRSVWVHDAGFGVVFQDDRLPTLGDVKRASGLKILDVVLAPSKDGKRFFCPMHPGKASAGAETCPECGMKMKEVAVSTAGGETRREP